VRFKKQVVMPAQSDEHSLKEDKDNGESERSRLTAEAAGVDALIEPYLDASLAALEGPAPLLVGMARYHLGEVDAAFDPAPPSVRSSSQGKRLRPALALHCCAAAGGDPHTAAPVAAAIELLHNFTLVHDDIQDRSDQRRHRPTIWSIWGEGQAINAGDALFAAAHLALYRLAELGVAPATVVRLSDAFARTTIEIVQGQVLDLGFEGLSGVTPDAYLRMIELKTAAIVRYAAWAGAVLAGADDARADRFAEFGRALGLGFQVRDDLLGIWGTAEVTGKPAADDIRRRKQSLPILLLLAAAEEIDRREIEALFAAPPMKEASVHRVIELLAYYKIRSQLESEIALLHDAARAALLIALDDSAASEPRTTLFKLVTTLALRES
jgi:geranylgeranyl diphosphate synthase type I